MGKDKRDHNIFTLQVKKMTLKLVTYVNVLVRCNDFNLAAINPGTSALRKGSDKFSFHNRLKIDCIFYIESLKRVMEEKCPNFVPTYTLNSIFCLLGINLENSTLPLSEEY